MPLPVRWIALPLVLLGLQVLPGQPTASAAPDSRDDPHATSLLAPATATITYGRSKTLATVLSDTAASEPVAGATVSLLARPSGSESYTEVGTTTTNGSGLAAVPVTPEVTTSYVWSFAGDDTRAAVDSTPGAVSVAPIPHPALKKETVRKGAKGVVYGTVTPVDAGAQVTLLRKTRTGFMPVDSDTIRQQRLPRIGTTTGFLLEVTTERKGTMTLKVIVAAANGLTAATSETLKLRVT